MSKTSQTPAVNGASGAAMAFLTVVVILTVIILGVRFLLPAAPAIDADRGAERAKALADIRAAEDTALTTPAWVDQDRQIVRLPIDIAIQLTVRDWQNPEHVEQAREALIARGVKATAPLPKTAPKPSAFE